VKQGNGFSLQLFFCLRVSIFKTVPLTRTEVTSLIAVLCLSSLDLRKAVVTDRLRIVQNCIVYQGME